MLRYLLDENLGTRLRSALRQADPQMTVWCVGDVGAPPYGTKDPEILRWCEIYDFVLVTENRKSMPVHLHDHVAAGKHVPGIFVLPPKYRISDVVDELILIGGASLPDEYQDQIRYLPVS